MYKTLAIKNGLLLSYRASFWLILVTISLSMAAWPWEDVVKRLILKVDTLETEDAVSVATSSSLHFILRVETSSDVSGTRLY